MYFLHFSLSPSSKVEPGPKEEEKQPQADPERRRASQEELDGGRARRARLGELVAVFFTFFFGVVEVEVDELESRRRSFFQCFFFFFRIRSYLSPSIPHQLHSHKECRSSSETRSSQTECERREGRLGDRGLERDDGLSFFF